MESIIKGIKLYNNRITFSEKLVYALTLSIFLSIYVNVIMLVIVFFHIILNKDRRKTLFSSPLSYYILVFFTLIVITPIFRKWYLGSLIAVGFCILITIMFWIRSFMTIRILRNIERISCVMSIFAFLVGLVQFCIYSDIPGFRVDSIFINPNYYATIIEFIIILCVWRIIDKRSSKYIPFSRTIYFLVIVVNIIGLYLSDCRSAWIAILSGVFLLLILRKKYFELLIAILIAIIGIFAAFNMPDVFPRLQVFSASSEMRIYIWKMCYEGFLQSPIFGYGAMSGHYLYLKQVATNVVPQIFIINPIYHSHNIYIDSLVNFGIVGTLFILYYIYKEYSLMIKSYYKNNSREICSLIFAITAVLLFHGLTDVTIFGVSTSTMFILVFSSIGIIVKKN